MSLTVEGIIILITVLSLCVFLVWHTIRYGRNSIGPFLWPCVGFLPDIILNVERLYEWTLPFFEVCFTSHTSTRTLKVIPGQRKGNRLFIGIMSFNRHMIL